MGAPSTDRRAKLEQNLTRILGRLQSAFRVLEGIGPLDQLTEATLKSHARWPEVGDALTTIYALSSSLEEHLMLLHVIPGSALLTATVEQRGFYRDTYLPYVETAKRLYFDTHVRIDLTLGDESPPIGETSYPRSNPDEYQRQRAEEMGIDLLSGIDLTSFMLDVYDRAEADVEDGVLDVDPAFYRLGRYVLDSPWFQPTRWLQNSARIGPTLVEKPIEGVPMWVRNRVDEVRACLVHDLHLAAIALCRSALEAAIIERGRTIGLEPFDVSGERTRKLSDLAYDLRRKRPELEGSLDAVVDYGNQALHAATKSQRVQHVVTPSSAERFSLHCFIHLRRILEVLYARPASREKNSD